MTQYRVFHRGLKGVRKLYPLDHFLDYSFGIIEKEPNADYYESIYVYNDEHKKQLDETKTLSGINGVKTDRIVFDFDSKSDIQLAKQDAINLVGRLKQEFPENAIRIFFSANKGFHVEIHLNKFLSRDTFETIIDFFAGDLETFDTKVKDEQRLFRFPLTKHNKSGLYKIPLTQEQLFTSTVDEIKELAKELRPEFYDLMDSYSISTIDETKYQSTREKKEVKKTEFVAQDRPDLSRKPKHLTPAKYTLQEGFFEEGERNEACMILASTYKYLGYNQEHTYNIIKATLRLRASRLGLPEYDKEELWQTIIAPIYSPTWKGGTFSEDDGLLKLTIERYGLDKTNISDVGLIPVNSIASGFKTFAQNIEANTIKLGIDEIDKKVRMTTGMLVSFLAAPGTGKCLGKDTPVRMYDGTVKMVQDVQIGDLLMGDDSTPRKVLSTTTGREELFRVDQEYGDSYVVNKSHILSLKCVADFTDPGKAKKYVQNKIVDIEVSDYLLKPKSWRKYYKGYKVAVDYKYQPVELDPYILGAWLGDGTSAKTEITTPDPEIIEYFNDYTKNEFNLETKEFKKLSYTYTSGKRMDNPFLDLLRKYNVLNNKHIPKEYLHNDRNTRLQLLAGLIDTDGYIDQTKTCAGEITFKSKILAENTVELIRSLGLKAVINEKIAKYKSFIKNKWYVGESLVYRIYFSGNGLNEIPMKVAQKKVTKNHQYNNVLSTGIKLISLGEGDYYGFEIDGNKRFLLGDFTVTHNTSMSLGILNNLSLNGEKAIFFSMDMGADQVYQRLIQRHTGHDADRILKNYENNIVGEIETYENVVAKNYENIKFCFKTSLTPEAIKATIIQEYNLTGKYPKMILLDYLECIQTNSSDPTQSKAVAALALKDIANEFGINVFLLTQPTKLAGGPAGELNSYVQIKGSGVVGEQSTIVLTMSRPGFSPKNPEDDNYVTINVVKNRLGGLSSTDLHWNGLTGQIRSLTSEEENDLKALRAAIANEKNQKDDLY